MKKLAILSLVTLLLANLSNASRDSGVYLKGELAAMHSSIGTTVIAQSNIPVSNFHAVSILPKSLALGYKFNDSIRAEVNFAHGKFIFKNSMTLFGVNTYFDVKVNSVITPYLAAGMGNTRFRILYLFKSNNLSWNIGVGTLLRLSENFDLDLGYRYVNYRTPWPQLTNHEGLIGIIYHL